MSYKLYDAEIEYLENYTGKEAIDTGIYGTNTTQVSLEVMFFNTEVPDYTGGDAFGSGVIEWGKTQKVLGITYNRNNGNVFSWLGNNYKVTEVNLLTGIKHTITYSSKGAWVNGVKVQDGWYNNSFQTPYTISAMTSRSAVSGDFGGSLKARLYNFSISDNGILVRDLIPVRVGNVGYMYDKVSGQLFGNSGTGSFVLGPDVAPGRYANEIAFLESTGSQYIDTGIKPTNNTRFVITMDLPQMNVSDLVAWFFGSRNGALDAECGLMYHRASNQRVWIWKYGNLQTTLNNEPSSGVTVFDNYTTSGANELKINNLTLSATASTFTGSYNFYLFTYNVAGTPAITSCLVGQKLISAKLYEGTTLVRDFIPVEYNNIGYLYDKVSGEFFANQGTGKFVLGHRAPRFDGKACARSYTRRQLMAEHSGYERLSYISNEGHTAGRVFPYINLGIRITPTMRLYTDVQVISKGTSAYIHGVDSTPTVAFSAVWNSSQSGYYYRATANSVYYRPTTTNTRTRAQLTLDKDTFTVERGGSTYTSTVTAGDNFKTNANFCLFFATGYPLSWEVAAMRMWSFKIWDNNVLIMDLVPVRDKSTKEIGLLNVVNHRFYGAVRGTFVGA